MHVLSTPSEVVAVDGDKTSAVRPPGDLVSVSRDLSVRLPGVFAVRRHRSWPILWGPFRTATLVANRVNWRYSAALCEFGTEFLNGEQRSVNRKVQGSNPCPGAN
jgi:hypothetical protein